MPDGASAFHGALETSLHHHILHARDHARLCQPESEPFRACVIARPQQRSEKKRLPGMPAMAEDRRLRR